MKVLMHTHNQQEAAIIVSFLRAHDIEAQVIDDAINSVLPMPGGVRVVVADNQEEEAITLLNNADDDGLLPSKENDE